MLEINQKSLTVPLIQGGMGVGVSLGNLAGHVSDKDALTIYGSLNTSVKKKIDYKRNIVVIKGGNHANFGNYGHQKGDAKATISRKKQQNQTVKAINNFIEKRLN